ncbi:CPBP family intramembrane glutamic endopeptidase [Paenibacillus xylanivorans]|uniref:CAAX prenyl protease 2/Lysostaphin resistance protein A-like domain-containing protein n=1 Tax=Paenibacillus xylanivorans TaxID=1705561 RepID=A0A0M9BTL4_9BACL|nr:type II CAAX endopeptidase family protein [Paenibacillus xylanivorans]KOY17902.1 hypothetical protein AMS66_02840 [Paenibacillus xylanivorans]
MTEVKMHEEMNQLRRPGWPEIVVCFVIYVVVVLVMVQIISAFIPEDTVFFGLSLSALSAFAAVCAFLGAYFLRIRTNASFGLIRVSGRWLLIGVGVGVGVFALAKISSILYLMLGFQFTNIQESYSTAATGGVLSFIIQIILIAVATPIGEELAFRGVLTSALLRYQPWICIFVSALVFTVAHGLNEITPIAFITGVATAYLFYRTKSIWPGVVVHMVNNALGTILSVLIASML